jgi:DNA-binding response OmpR family regulator
MNGTSLLTMRIGIVEDDSLLRNTLSLILSHEPYRTPFSMSKEAMFV